MHFTIRLEESTSMQTWNLINGLAHTNIQAIIYAIYSTKTSPLQKPKKDHENKYFSSFTFSANSLNFFEKKKWRSIYVCACALKISALSIFVLWELWKSPLRGCNLPLTICSALQFRYHSWRSPIFCSWENAVLVLSQKQPVNTAVIAFNSFACLTSAFLLSLLRNFKLHAEWFACRPSDWRCDEICKSALFAGCGSKASFMAEWFSNIPYQRFRCYFCTFWRMIDVRR